jgi:outer membrane protein assembly factor BamB
MIKKFIFAFHILILVHLTLQAAENSQWRGPARNGIYPEKNLLKTWPKNGPKLLWSAEGIGIGYSSAAVAGEKVYITGMIDGIGYLSAYDTNGKLLWKIAYGSEWTGGRPGARTTPTVVGDFLYIMSGNGLAVCLEANKGKIVWSVNLVEKFGARNLKWGMTESPVVDGDRVIYTPGGTDAVVVALNRFSGKTIWKSKVNAEKSAYASPVIVKHGNARLLLTMTGKSTIALNPDNGDLIWTYPHITKYGINPNTPMYSDGFIFSVSGYGTGGEKLKLSKDGTSITEVWRDENLDSQMGAAIILDGYIYGSGHRNKDWYCLDWETGEVKYSSRELGGKGNIIFADGLLYCYGENGEVALVKPNPNAFEVVSSFDIPLGENEHWAHLVIADGQLYVRHGSAVMVYSIAR